MLSNASYGRQPSASPTRGCLWLLWLGLFASLVSPSLSFVDTSCCPEGTVWERSANCSDGSRIQLDCPFGIFIIDPELSERDNFSIHHDDTTAWLHMHVDDLKIPADMFCVTKSKRISRNDIALTCFDEDLINDGSPMVWKNILVCIVSIISAIFLIATLAVYVILPELRELQDKAMMAAVTTLAVSYTVLSVQHLRPTMNGDYNICVTLGFILYFAFMSAFFWLNIVAFNVWRAVWFKNFRVREQSLFYSYCVWGWGGPACFLIAALTMHLIDGHHLKPGFGDASCWFGGARQTWAYFYGPVAILLTLNIIYLGLTSWRLWHQYRDYTGSKLRVLRFKCLLYIKLVLVMGITWIFEVISFAVDTNMDEFWIPTDLLNGLQGFVIFLLLVATRKRVRKLLAKKRPCGIGFPKSWAAYEDEECEAVLPEELELSQQG
ncbi:PREDICTED: G-protein coupled receptor Mth2-like isoform X2 [Dinoponera quadriceps]|uniref:G-protein coupled receptor Mth2-like isoform X2 n=1 Tax=Dinoponera quadriceps TaxID=609295 RepID=A0A6P3WZD5_DINQU|nr:PREDICTED: G-protein coupled receptor Mth2-like isoform X2 [Dinoponera quadriceps]